MYPPIKNISAIRLPFGNDAFQNNAPMQISDETINLKILIFHFDLIF